MITLKNISKTYKNGELEVQALQPLNLKVEQGSSSRLWVRLDPANLR